MPHGFIGKKIKHDLTALYNDSETVVYQTKDTASEIQQQDQEETSFIQGKATMLNANQMNTCAVMNGIRTISRYYFKVFYVMFLSL